MIAALLLSLVLSAQAQEVSSDTANVPIYDQIELSNLGKQVRDIIEGRAIFTGRPYFKQGYCFGVPNSTDCQDTAPSASASVTIPAGSTLTFTQVFTTNGSTLTIGNSAKCAGCFSVVASSYPAEGIRTIAFANFKASTTYRLLLNVALDTTDGHPIIQFDGNNGANYDWGYDADSVSEGSVIPNQTAGDTACRLMAPGSAAWDAGTQGFYEIIFATNPRNSKRVAIQWRHVATKATPSFATYKGGCRFHGSADVSIITFSVTGGGTMVGQITLEELGRL